MDVLWRVGDQWRELNEDLHRVREATLLTMHGSVHLLDLNEWRQLRIRHGERMSDDDRWWILGTIEATPCGLHSTIRGGSWHSTGRLRLVVAGHDAGLASTPAGIDAMAAEWSAPGHGEWRCRSVHCTLADPTVA